MIPFYSPIKKCYIIITGENKMQKTFSDIFEEYLNYHLADLAGQSLNGMTGYQISSVLFNKTREIFSKCNFTFSEDTCRFLANIYLNDIEVNGQKFNFVQDSLVGSLPAGELDMLEGMFFDRDDVLEEIRKNRK